MRLLSDFQLCRKAFFYSTRRHCRVGLLIVMRSFTIIVCLLVLLATIIRADDDGSSPRKARRPGKARSSLQGYHAKLLREKFKKPIKKAENTRKSKLCQKNPFLSKVWFLGADETRVKNIQVYKPGQASTRRKAPRLSPAEMQRLVEEKQRVLKQRKKEHQKEGKQDGSRAASSSITDRRTSLTRDAARKKKKLKNYWGLDWPKCSLLVIILQCDKLERFIKTKF